MNDQETNNLINDFLRNVDKGEELQHNINMFANEVAPALLGQLDQDGVIARFEDTLFSFKFLTNPNSLNKLVFQVKMLDLNKYREALRLSVPETVTIKKAQWEHDGTYQLVDELSKMIVVLLFDYYEIPMGNIEDQGEEGTVRVKS